MWLLVQVVYVVQNVADGILYLGIRIVKNVYWLRK